MSSTNFREKYKTLKKRTKTLIFEHECLQHELEKAQRKLLKVTRDNSFLLDRLAQYEQVIVDGNDDSDLTPSSDSDSESHPAPKKRIITSGAAKSIKVEVKDEHTPRNSAQIKSVDHLIKTETVEDSNKSIICYGGGTSEVSIQGSSSNNNNRVVDRHAVSPEGRQQVVQPTSDLGISPDNPLQDNLM